MEQKNLKLAVKNFGPIREGEVEFKPLTVFIGPNNSGKSYMAVLLYALMLALLGRRGFPYRPGFMSFDISNEDVELLTEWLGKLSAGSVKETDNLTHRIQSMLCNYIDDERSEFQFGVQDIFREYFGCRSLSDLIYRNLTDFSVNLFKERGNTPLVSVREWHGNSQVEVDMEQDWYALVKAHGPRFIGVPVRESFLASEFSFVLRQLWREKLISTGMPEGNVFYLPAGRSGLLQGWQLAASFAVGMIGTRIGTQDFEVPSFPGVARDFTQQLLGLMPPSQNNEGTGDLAHAIGFMEEKILHGKIDIRANDNVPAMGYESEGLKIPMQRVSSMISELAPIHLWMKHILKSGDVLIIDEPEAHLHPENQRLIARVLVRLMNAGVRVVCTTHSSLILHQLSNQILATSSGKLGKVGFAEHDKLDMDDIGVYLFELAEDGSRIKEVEIDSDFGISEDEFVRVADQIGDETYQLVT